MKVIKSVSLDHDLVNAVIELVENKEVSSFSRFLNNSIENYLEVFK